MAETFHQQGWTAGARSSSEPNVPETQYVICKISRAVWHITDKPLRFRCKSQFNIRLPSWRERSREMVSWQMLPKFCCTKVGRYLGVPSGTYLPWHFPTSISLRYMGSFVFGESCGKVSCKQTAKDKPEGPLAARDFVHCTCLTEVSKFRQVLPASRRIAQSMP
jgi:hypothetical protein